MDYGNSHEHHNATGTTLRAFLFGAGLGAAVGLLYAPRSGAATRARIADQTVRIKDGIADRAAHVRGNFADLAHSLTERFEGWKEIVATHGPEVMEIASEAMSEAAAGKRR